MDPDLVGALAPQAGAAALPLALLWLLYRVWLRNLIRDADRADRRYVELMARVEKLEAKLRDRDEKSGVHVGWDYRVKAVLDEMAPARAAELGDPPPLR